jgi:cytochrome d ubiquinol oxidase subunit II
LGAGAVSGVLSIAGLVVLHHDAYRLYHELVAGDGLPAVIVSVIAGLATFGLVVRERFEPARYTAGLAVAAIVAGWALAQSPIFLPGLTVKQAAAPHDVLVAMTVAVLGGAVILFPSLVLLFRLTLGGRLGHGHEEQAATPSAARRELVLSAAPGLLGRVAAACLLAGFGLLTVAEAGWAHAIGVVALFGFIVVGFAGAVPALLEGEAGA